jgi:cell division protein FtsN
MTLLAFITSALLHSPARVRLAARQERYPPRQPPRRSSGRASSPVRRTLFHAPSFSAGVVMGAVVVLGAAYLPEMLGGQTRDPALGPVPADARPKLTFEFDHLLRNNEVAADPEPYHSAPRVRTSPLAATDSPVQSEPMTPVEATTQTPGPVDVPAAPTPATAPATDVAAAGPAAARELAEAVAREPVTWEPTAPEPTVREVAVREAAAPTPAEVFTLQAASFRSPDDANRLRAALLLMDLPASTTSSALADGVWYRVTVGPFSSRAEAERAMTRMREQNISAIWSRG